jgi:hypothetical protein
MAVAPAFISPRELVLRKMWANAVAIAHTGTTSETTKVRLTIPAGMMGLHGRIEYEVYHSFTNGADDKILRAKFGGTTFQSRIHTTAETSRLAGFIANRGALDSQVGNAGQNAGGWGSSADTVVTASVDTSANAVFTLTCQLETSGDNLTIQAWCVKVFGPAY